jgi:acetyl-CoA C-acetyltransferase
MSLNQSIFLNGKKEKKMNRKGSEEKGRTVYIVDGSRTAFLKAKGRRNPFSASDLAEQTCRTLLMRQSFLPSDLEEVIAGCMMPSEKEANVARVVALRLGCGVNMPAWTVQRNCASGMQALDSAAKDIRLGRHDLVLAGGMEAMSHSPLLYSPEFVDWMASWMSADNIFKRLSLLPQLRPRFFKPVIALLQGLTDHIVSLGMGQTAEKLAYIFDISREEMDAFSLESHQRWCAAYDQGFYKEITPLYDTAGKVYQVDDGVRRETTLEKLASLKPFFDKPFGKVTAGNSSQVTDGAAFLILASEDALKQYHLKPLGKIVDVEWAALDPSIMGLGPVHAAAPIIQRQQLKLSDIDYWEINEAFAAQVIACIKAFESDDYCRTHFGMNKAVGSIDRARLNIDGGAIAMGHPIGASGARIVWHLLQVLKRNGAKRGMAAICIGGGQGGAMLIETVEAGE